MFHLFYLFIIFLHLYRFNHCFELSSRKNKHTLRSEEGKPKPNLTLILIYFPVYIALPNGKSQ